jgi:hypothetical protein
MRLKEALTDYCSIFPLSSDQELKIYRLPGYHYSEFHSESGFCRIFKDPGDTC